MKALLVSLLLLSPALARAQAIINSWIVNTAGAKGSQWGNNGGQPPTYTFVTMTDSADALKVCYTADSVWVCSHSITDNMGKWLNPGSAVAQNFVHRFPRTPVVPTTKSISPKGGQIGLLINGIVIYGLGNAASWTGTTNSNPQAGGQGIWNVEVGKSEGFVLDTAFGAHPQQQGVYHTHTTPYRLYKATPSTQHSPLIGWAFDGYPIYGPYGYSSPMDATSSTTRMKTGYSLRNITTRTTLPYGVTATQTGPPVNTTYPIGTYCEDYEWLPSNSGDLDKYNGRTCVTPEFPNGTYAYFVTVDAAGVAAFPYYIGIEYYGAPDSKNFPAGPNGNGLSIPANTTGCRLPGSTGIAAMLSPEEMLSIVPNPATGGRFTIRGNGHSFYTVTVMDMQGRKIYGAAMDGAKDHAVSLNVPGIYLVRCEDGKGGPAVVSRVAVR